MVELFSSWPLTKGRLAKPLQRVTVSKTRLLLLKGVLGWNISQCMIIMYGYSAWSQCMAWPTLQRRGNGARVEGRPENASRSGVLYTLLLSWLRNAFSQQSHHTKSSEGSEQEKRGINMSDLNTNEDMPSKGSIAVTSWGGHDSAVYYTDTSGGIRERTYHKGDWSGGTTSDIIFSGKNTTPLAVMQWFWNANGYIPMVCLPSFPIKKKQIYGSSTLHKYLLIILLMAFIRTASASITWILVTWCTRSAGTAKLIPGLRRRLLRTGLPENLTNILAIQPETQNWPPYTGAPSYAFTIRAQTAVSESIAGTTRIRGMQAHLYPPLPAPRSMMARRLRPFPGIHPRLRSSSSSKATMVQSTRLNTMGTGLRLDPDSPLRKAQHWLLLLSQVKTYVLHSRTTQPSLSIWVYFHWGIHLLV